MYYRNAAAAIIVYDITNDATFDVLQEWITELHRLGPQNIVLAIAGNKCDLEDKREVCVCVCVFWLYSTLILNRCFSVSVWSGSQPECLLSCLFEPTTVCHCFQSAKRLHILGMIIGVHCCSGMSAKGGRL